MKINEEMLDELAEEVTVTYDTVATSELEDLVKEAMRTAIEKDRQMRAVGARQAAENLYTYLRTCCEEKTHEEKLALIEDTIVKAIEGDCQ